jgi:hypothetical protein
VGKKQNKTKQKKVTKATIVNLRESKQRKNLSRNRPWRPIGM